MDIFSSLILLVLGFASLVTILDVSGFLPERLARWLARNRLNATVKSLQRLGVRVCWDEEKSTVRITDRILHSMGITEPSYKVELRRLLEEDSYQGGVLEVGATRIFSVSKFIDVMGATACSTRAVRYARLMQTHLEFEDLTYDVATPRAGSPILGYEFARLGGKPFILGVNEKVHDKEGLMASHATLDYSKDLDLTGKRVLLVDDSTTGGRKQIELAKAPREAGALVENSLVLFEPQGKGAREKLKQEDIQLYAIQTGPDGSF